MHPRRRPSAALWRSAAAILLGLSARGTRPERRRPPNASSFEVPDAASNALQFSRAYWLPPFGRGNGLEALFWAPVGQVPEERADEVMDALAGQDIPAWTAPARPPQGRNDVWVASADLDAAQDAVMRLLRG